MKDINEQIVDSIERAHQIGPDEYPSRGEYSDFTERTKAIAASVDTSWPFTHPLSSALRVSHPLKLAAYRVACGTITMEHAVQAGAVHPTDAGGRVMLSDEIRGHLDILVAAYRK